MLQHNDKERDYAHRIEEERYKLVNPLIDYLEWVNSNEQDDRWGRINSKNYADPKSIFCDYNWSKKLYEFENGVKILTNNIELYFSTRELQNKDIKLKIGDIVKLMGQSHEILSVHETDLIQGSQFDYLHYVCVINTKQTTES